MKPVAEGQQFVLIEFLLLVRDVSTFAGLAQPVALDGARQNNRGRTLVAHSRVIGGVNLNRIMAAQPHAPKIVVAPVGHHCEQARVHAIEVLADVRAAGD